MAGKPLSLQDTMITCLTDMTGRKASEARQVMIPKINVDVPKRSLIVFLYAFGPGVFLAFLIVFLAGVPWLAGLGGFLLVEFLAFFLFERRVRDGLQVRTYTEMVDKRRRPTGVLMLGGVEIDPSGGGPGTIVAACVPVTPGQRTSAGRAGAKTAARPADAALSARMLGKDS